MLWTEDFVQVNKFSRPGSKLIGVKGIVVHWTADPGATDENEQNYFDGSDGGGGRYASAHLFVDKDSATLMIPLDEVSYHANEKPCQVAKLKATRNGYIGGANLTAIGVEMCVEKDGTIHPDTVNRTVQIVAALCKQFHLTENDIYRHYDVTGKNCPEPFITNPALFTKFKNDVKTILQPSNILGVITVTTDSLNVRQSPDVNSPKVQPPLKKGQTFKVYALKNGWYNVGSGWVSGNYVTFKK